LAWHLSPEKGNSMKIQSLHFVDVGPLGTQDIDLHDQWAGDIESNILFTGPNGCGKSTLLRAVAMLWEAAGYWLAHQDVLPKNHVAAKWLSRWGAVGMVLTDVDIGHAERYAIGFLFFNQVKFAPFIEEKAPEVNWIGQNSSTGLYLGDGGNVDWLEKLTAARQRMSLSFSTFGLPNMIFMDAEERRWVAPTQDIGEIVAEQPGMRWAPRYIPTEDWRGQLESSLINMKLTDEVRFNAVLVELNTFLIGKKIESEIRRGEKRLRVSLTRSGKPDQFHTMDELSSGERQVLIMLYTIARWAEPGCVVMIDEPDLYLHPSLIEGMLSRIKAMVKGLDGQLLITSHLPMVWERYEGSARRIELAAAGDAHG
jgi:energy-coupling factor transporter ATP-binding protein EcfA2